MKTNYVIHAYAKLNLSLKILHKRSDGFHELETVMVPVPELADKLSFSASSEYALTCNDESLTVGEENLITKAVRAFERAANKSVTYQVHLEKNIPHGAGLGGGSSDAAHTLLTLNHLNDNVLPFDTLHEICSSLGSDIPFFLYNSPCICRGRGEKIEVLPQQPPTNVLILKPEFGISTPSAFNNWKTAQKVSSFFYDDQIGPYGTMNNDLEQPVFEKYIFLGALKSWLLAHDKVQVAQMSGSGSTMFAFTASDEDSQQVIAEARRDLDPNLFSWFGSI